MKLKLLLAAIITIFLMLLMALAVVAQEGEAPPPYAGLKNPFPWDDASAQSAGKAVYQNSCVGCHGTNGANFPAADFSAPGFSQGLEERPDLYFWWLSEGKLNKGMPAYKSSLSEEQRWQVLTYLRSLGKATPANVIPPPVRPPMTAENIILHLEVPSQADSGHPLALSAVLQDHQGSPIEGATIKFFIQVDFFTRGLMEIGEAITNDKGVAVLDYIPRHTGQIEVRAAYETVEATAHLKLPDTDKHFYVTHIGIDVPSPWRDMSIGESHLELGEGNTAPPTVFRLPTGALSWLTPLLWAAMAIWIVYFYVVYQVFRIPIVGEIRDIDTRRIPRVGLVIVVAVGILLVLMLVTSPLSHPHGLP
ncbi:MAG: hypothetical protein A2144_02480 [Chloroflexi bacterium RBG_16_50_9]|nr:MAG: hypothetical protein A2144_02480 [Chloroflexi bacterium RBG_16_50_9]